MGTSSKGKLVIVDIKVRGADGKLKVVGHREVRDRSDKRTVYGTPNLNLKVIPRSKRTATNCNSHGVAI